MPSRRDPFVGRASLLERAQSALRSGERLVTLVGAGGIGKTRLALEIAQRLVVDPNDRGDGAVFCDCSESRTADELATSLLNSLASARVGSDTVAESASALASAGRVLVVIDNVEQVIEPAAQIVQRWLAVAPEARLVVTSRARLRVMDECVIDVDPLDVAPPECTDAATLRACESVALFVARASRSSRGRTYAPSDRELRAIAELTRRLDGLPLAIELFAGRARTFAIEQLLAALDEQWPELADRGRPSRQSTLRNAVAWSWNLLDPREQRALASLSVFRGGFDLDAARAVLSEDTHALETVASLHEQSLLRVDECDEDGHEGSRRFSMFDAVRTFAFEQLATLGGDARAEAERRHAEHYARVGDALSQSERDERETSRLAAREQANLLAAFERSLPSEPACAVRALNGLAPILATAMPFDRAIALADRAVVAAERSGSANTRSIAFALRGDVRRRHSLSAAEEDLRASLAAPDIDTALEARARSALGVVLRDQGRFTEASEQLERALTLGGESTRDAAVVLLSLATVRRREGRGDAATSFGERALAIAHRNRDRHIEGRALLVLGLLDDDCARLELALGRIERAVDLLRASGDRWNEEVALNATGLLHAELGRPVEARAYFDEALSICDELGFRAGAACVLGNLAWLDAATGDVARAIERCHQSLAIARDVGHRFFEASALATLGALEARRDRIDASRDAFSTAVRCATEFPSPSLRASIDVSLGALELAEARALRASGESARCNELQRLARARLDRAAALPVELRDGDVRTAMRALRAALGERDEHERAPQWLRVWEGCVAFQIEGGEVVDLRRFGVHRRVLAELVRAHEQDAEARRTVVELFARVWPGERVGLRSMRNRVHVALCALRKAGLASALESHADGYRIARDVRVEPR